MIYHCDALLETNARYASLKFRRFSRWFRPTKLDWADAVELVAFVESIGGAKHARYVFHWGQAGVRAYGRLKRHVADAAQPYIRANREHFSVDAGLAVLRAMQDGGWQGHGLPEIVRKALQSLNETHTQAEIARRVGLSVDQVGWAIGRRGQAAKRRRAASVGALAIG